MLHTTTRLNLAAVIAAILTTGAGQAPSPDLTSEAVAAFEQSAAADVLAHGRVAGVDYARVRLQLNDTFPWILGVAMFPCLIDALPALPSVLQYRIVGRDLVLIDVHASLIVDILTMC